MPVALNLAVPACLTVQLSAFYGMLQMSCFTANRPTACDLQVYTWQNSTAAHGSLLSNPATLSTGANNLLSSGLLLGFYGGEDVVSE